MMGKKNPQELASQLITMIGKPKNPDELFSILATISTTVGGMVCHFDREDRSQVLMQLTEAMGKGFINVSVSLGEPSDIELIVGERK